MHDNLHFVVKIRIANLDVQHEAVELRFGQGIGAFLLDGVLRRQNKERQIQRVGRAAGGDLVLLHRLQQGRLCLGRRAIDFVSQQDIREDRAFEKLKLSSSRGRRLPGRCRCR